MFFSSLITLRKPATGRQSGRDQLPSRSPTLPNVIVHKAKHIIPVRDAIKYTLYNSSGQASPNRQTTAADTSFGSTSSPPPKHSPPPPPITPSHASNKSSTLPVHTISAHSNPIYQSLTSQLSHQNTQSISLNRLMSHPYFRSHYLLNNSVRRSANEKKSLSNSFTNSNSQPDQAQDHSTNSTLKSYLSDRNVSNSNPTTQTPNTNSVSPNKSGTLTKQHSARRSSRRSQRGTSAGKKLTEDQLRQKLAQYEYYIASQLDKVDSVEKKNAQEKRPKLTDEQWQQLVFNRIFLGANSILLLLAFIMLALACILDPNPIHKLDSKGGFYAFNAVVFIFLSLLGLYGMQYKHIRKKLLLVYAASIAFLLLFRLITGLVMLIALENNQSELIFLLSFGLIEMMLGILALANAFTAEQQQFDKLPNGSAIDGPEPIQVLCKDDSKPFGGDRQKTKIESRTDTGDEHNSFSKSSTLRRSMNANHAPRPPIHPNQSLRLQTTAGELVYISPDNLVFNERSVDAPAEPRKLEQRSSNYASNLTQYSTIAKPLSDKKGHKSTPVTRNIPIKVNNDELIQKTTLVAKPFQLSKDLLSKASKAPINKNETSTYRPSPTHYSTISHLSSPPAKKSDSLSDRRLANSSAQTPSNGIQKPTHKRQSSSFLTNTNLTNLPYRTSTPSNLPPVQTIGGGSNYSPQNTTGSIGTASKASIFDYNYSPLNLNQISHHILTSQQAPLKEPERTSANRLTGSRSQPSLATTRQNILINKMNFLNNNTYNSDQYKQSIIDQVVNESNKESASSINKSASSRWPRY